MQMQALAIRAEDPIEDLIREGRHREALTACARTHAAILGRLSMALLGSQADADEAVQETLLRAWRSPRVMAQDPATARSWMFTVARNLVVDEAATPYAARVLAEAALGTLQTLV